MSAFAKANQLLAHASETRQTPTKWIVGRSAKKQIIAESSLRRFDFERTSSAPDRYLGIEILETDEIDAWKLALMAGRNGVGAMDLRPDTLAAIEKVEISHTAPSHVTADPDSALGYICRMVARLRVGEKFRASLFDLQPCGSFIHNGALFTPADRVLENIVGSCFTHSYYVDHTNGDVTFERHEDTGRRHYTSPDRRELGE